MTSRMSVKPQIPDESAKSDFDQICSKWAQLLQWAYHDGLFDQEKEMWEQDIDEFKALWERMTNPRYVEILEAKRGTAMNRDWNRLFDEAYRQACSRLNGHQSIS